MMTREMVLLKLKHHVLEPLLSDQLDMRNDSIVLKTVVSFGFAFLSFSWIVLGCAELTLGVQNYSGVCGRGGNFPHFQSNILRLLWLEALSTFVEENV